MKPFFPSDQQAAYFDWIVDGRSGMSCQLEARAGTGKTTTLIQGLMRMRGTIFFGAFNRKIAEEIKIKIREIIADMEQDIAIAREMGTPCTNEMATIDVLKRVKVSTMHGAGFYACGRKWPQNKDNKNWVQSNKTRSIVDEMAEVSRQGAMEGTRPENEAALIEELNPFICQMVSLGKQFLMGCPTVSRSIDNKVVWEKLADHYGVDERLPEDGSCSMAQALEYVIQAYKEGINRCDWVIDHDDMIFCPIYFNMRMFQNDWVLMDEDQDANLARRVLARRMLKTNGRFVGVGDRHQAIYGFTGAGADSVQKIIEEFKCEVLGLTVTYRCPKQVVKFAQQWVKDIQAHPDAPEGTVAPVAIDPKNKDRWFVQHPPEQHDAILCRYVKPLIKTAYGMIKAGKACKVEGRDIGQGLIGLAKKWKTNNLDVMEARLQRYEDREVAKALAARNDKKQQDVIDRCDTLRIFIDKCRAQGEGTVACVVASIQDLFADDVTDVTVLSTGHKSKGREWDRVYWLQHSPRQNRHAWMDEQEKNLNYVITTRSKRELLLVPENLQ